MNTKKFMIIDGSSIFYRAFYAMPTLTAPSGEFTGAVVGFANVVLKLIRDFKPDYAAVALDVAKKTFRNEMFADYKGTREKMPDELAAQLSLLNEFTEIIGLKKCFAAGFEADDIIGTLAKLAPEDFEVQIVTGDRDSLQLINSHTKILLSRNTSIEIYNEEKFFAEYGFNPPQLVDFKGLSGDNSDNIPGVAGVGPKTATKLLQEYGTLENVLENVGNISGKKLRESLQNSIEIAKLSKKLAQIDCAVPNIKFIPNDFEIKPDLAHADEFCKRYALNVAKKKIHELFDSTENLFGDPLPANSDENILQVPEVGENFDFEKILHEKNISVAPEFDDFGKIKSAFVKIFDGKIFNIDEILLSRIFDEFSGTIYVLNVKKILHSKKIPDLSKIFDVELAAYLLYPERENYSCAELLAAEFEGLKMSDESPAAKVTAIEKLGETFFEKLAAADLLKLYSEIELPLTEVLAKMEMRGVFIDSARLEEKAAAMSERIETLEKKIYELAGESFNINSPKQLAELLFEKLGLPPVKKTKTGFSTNAEVLETLKNYHPIIGAILNFRALTKLKSTYLDGIKPLINSSTGRVHTNFNQTVTATGRLSSSDPNLQNIPVRTEEGREIRALFEPGAGYDFLLSADYSQIELRLLAHMSGDENLIDAFIKNQDIHARTAAEVFGVKLAEVTPELRRKAKAVNFGIVYGISDYGLSRDLHISRREAGEYIELYFKRYPGVKNFLDETVAKAHELGYVTTMFGRRRFLPAIKSRNFTQRSLAERMAMNTPIQGSAADIIKLAMIHAEKKLQKFGSRIIIQVHDELVVETKVSELEEVSAAVRAAMENVVSLSVPLVVDVHYGKNWALAK